MRTTTELFSNHSAPARERGIIIWTWPYSHQQQVIIARRKYKEKQTWMIRVSKLRFERKTYNSYCKHQSQTYCSYT